MRGKFTTLCAMLVCVGCAETGPTIAQTEYSRLVAEDIAARKAAQPCYGALAQTPEWPILVGKLWAAADPDIAIPKSILANKNRPTEGESRALIALHGNAVKCRQIVTAGLARAHPSILQSHAAREAAYDSLMRQLVQRQIGWGEFAQANLQMSRAATEEQAVLYERIAAQFNQAHAAQIRQRQADAAASDRALETIGNALGAAGQQYQQSRTAPAPVYTNCQRTGNVVNCTSF